jgi:hypothetical protein
MVLQRHCMFVCKSFSGLWHLFDQFIYVVRYDLCWICFVDIVDIEPENGVRKRKVLGDAEC